MLETKNQTASGDNRLTRSLNHLSCANSLAVAAFAILLLTAGDIEAQTATRGEAARSCVSIGQIGGHLLSKVGRASNEKSGERYYYVRRREAISGTVCAGFPTVLFLYPMVRAEGE